jgi:hypothetical protein
VIEESMRFFGHQRHEIRGEHRKNAGVLFDAIELIEMQPEIVEVGHDAAGLRILKHPIDLGGDRSLRSELVLLRRRSEQVVGHCLPEQYESAAISQRNLTTVSPAPGGTPNSTR